MGGIDSSLIVASIRKGWYSHFRTNPRSIAAERTDYISDRATSRDEHVHQEAPAIRGRSDFFDEQTGDTIAGIVICEGEVYGSLNLPAELPGLPLRLPVR